MNRQLTIRRLIPILLLFLCLALRLAIHSQLGKSPLPILRLWQQTDMWTYHISALDILDGDILCRTPVYPFHSWQSAIAPEQTWRNWYRPPTWYQAPLYVYMTALVYCLLPANPTSVVFFQMALGILLTILLYSIGNILWGYPFGLLPAVLVGFAQPLLFYEQVNLRDQAAAVGCGLLCYLLVRWLTSPRSERFALFTGITTAALCLLKPTFFLLIPILPLILHCAGHRLKRQELLLALAGLLAILVLPVARNLATGAPPVSLSTRGAINLIEGNAADSEALGFSVPTSLGPILHETGGRLLPTLKKVIDSWHGQTLPLIRFQLRKVQGILLFLDIPDNANLQFFEAYSPALRYSIPYSLLLILAVAGIFPSNRDRDKPIFRAFAVLFLTLVVGLCYTFLVGRFRLLLIPLLALFGARYVRALLRSFGARQRWQTVVLLLLGTLSGGVTHLVQPAYHPYRLSDFLSSASFAHDSGNLPEAIAILERGRREVRAGQVTNGDLQPILTGLCTLYRESGDIPRALTCIQEAIKNDPQNRQLRQYLITLAAQDPGKRKRLPNGSRK